MIALLKTAERTNNLSCINNYVFQRNVFAYKTVSINQLAGKQVLELGCGEGYGMQILSPHTKQYIAVDKKKPGARFFTRNISFQRCRLPFLVNFGDNSFDTIICFQVIEHIKNDNKLLSEIKRVLKPGGQLLLTTPNRLTSLTRNPFHVREYLPQEMCRLVSAHFSNCTVEGIYGNNAVISYYRENKKNVERLMRYDIFNLQYRLPAVLLRLPYSLLNNFNRFMLFRKLPNTTTDINYTDFYKDNLAEDCLDYFVTAEKQE